MIFMRYFIALSFLFCWMALPAQQTDISKEDLVRLRALLQLQKQKEAHAIPLVLVTNGVRGENRVVMRTDKAFWQSLAVQANSYAQLSDMPQYCVRKSAIHGVGLFALQTIPANADVLQVFKRTSASGEFIAQYSETPLATFVNHADSPNTRLEIRMDGVYMVALHAIGPGQELASSYKQLLAMFPGDKSLETIIRFW
jgi:hypothetical protein